MRRNKLLTTLSLLILVIATTACGKKKKKGVVVNNNSQYSCGAPLGPRPERVVRGDFGMGGAFIQLDIYSSETGSVGAVGSLNVADLSVFPYFYGPPGASFSTCLSSSGFTGFDQSESTKHSR
jgi:hypothetical protein